MPSKIEIHQIKSKSNQTKIDSKLLNKKPKKPIATPKVSIVVPSLNSIAYIHECIDSILNQTLKDIEIICVDAGSSDGTLEVLREYERKDSRLKVIVSSKKSYGYQMNLGIKEARGEYLGIVESDDYIKENMYERLYEIAKKYDCEVVKADMMDFIRTENGEQENTNHLLNWSNVLYHKKSNCKQDIRFLTESNIMNPSGIYNIKLIKKHNIKHNETPGAAFQDTGFWFQVQTLADSIYFLKEPLYYYRRDNTESSCNNTEKVYCICEEYDFIRNIFINNDVLKHDIIPIISYLRFLGYGWNLNRIDKKFRLEFIYKIKEDFENLEKEGEVDREMFKEWQLKKLLNILNSPDEFYKQIAQHPKGAVRLVKESQTYKIGNLFLQCKNLKSLFNLFSEVQKNSIQEKNKIMFCDYYESLRVREHLSYKFGKLLQTAYKNRFKGALFILPFQLMFVYKNFKSKQGR